MFVVIEAELLILIYILEVGLASHQTRFSPPFFLLKCPRPSKEYISCNHIVRFFVCWHCFFSRSVFLLFLLQWMLVHKVCFVTRIFFSIKQIYDYEKAVYYFCTYLSLEEGFMFMSMLLFFLSFLELLLCLAGMLLSQIRLSSNCILSD